MARVRGGLFSVEASGQFAKNLVFDRRGYVREYKVPSNPKTALQGDQRQKFLGMQRIVRSLSATYRDFLKAAAPMSSRWHNYFIALMSDRYDHFLGVYNALPQNKRDDWTNRATTASSILNIDVEYAAAAPTAGFFAFLAASTFYSDLSDPANLGDPATVNTQVWMVIFA